MNTGIETLNLIKEGRILNYGFNKKELDFLIKLQKDDCQYFHLTIQSGLSNDEKLKLVKNYINNYKKINKTRKKIINLLQK